MLMAGAAAAQEPPKPVGQNPGDQQPKETTCPPAPSAGAKPEDAQPVEKSAILPSAGGHQNSAAPTVQQDGKPMEQRADCPKLPKGSEGKPPS
jgi:hypothetical protein